MKVCPGQKLHWWNTTLNFALTKRPPYHSDEIPPWWKSAPEKEHPNERPSWWKPTLDACILNNLHLWTLWKWSVRYRDPTTPDPHLKHFFCWKQNQPTPPPPNKNRLLSKLRWFTQVLVCLQTFILLKFRLICWLSPCLCGTQIYR